MAPSTSDTPVPGTRRAPQVVAGGDRAGQRIDNFLISRLADVPRSRIYRMIRRGEVRVNGRRVRPTYRLQAEDQIRIPPHHASAPRDPFIGEQQLGRIEAAIIHEDDRLLVLDKPAGVAVHGGSGVAFGVIEALRRLRPQADLELVHRLDRDTSGCLLVAKRRAELRLLQQHLRSDRIDKLYRVIVHGQWPAGRRLVDDPLERYVTGSGERRVRVAVAGKPSRTHFTLEAQNRLASLLRVRLETGRTHQIRVHARAAGHPVVGDEKYAPPQALELARSLGIQRLCLHAERLVIRDEEAPRVFEAPLPGEFTQAWQRLEQAADPGSTGPGENG